MRPMNRPDTIRSTLLDLHKTVLDTVRRDYERDRGTVRDSDFLNALIDEQQLGWLKPMTSLVARLDEALDEDDRVHPQALMGELRTLIAPDTGSRHFQQKYADILERSPDALVAHVRAMRALKTS